MESIFDPGKATQVAVRFLELNGGSIDRYTLIKLMYEADRVACARWSHSLTGDQPYSMEHGPVLSAVCNLTKGNIVNDSAIWSEYISSADTDHIIALKKPLADKDRLSKRDHKIIAEVFGRLGTMNFNELKRWSHSLPEYEEVPKGSSKRIPLEHRLKAVGKTAAQIQHAEEESRDESMARILVGEA